MTWVYQIVYQILVTTLVLVGPPPKGEPSPERAPVKTKADLLNEARLKRGLPKKVYEKVKDYKYKFECGPNPDKVYVYATDKMEFENGQAKIESYHAVHIFKEGKKDESMNHWTGSSAPGHHVLFQFDRKVKSFADVKKARIIQFNYPGGGSHKF